MKTLSEIIKEFGFSKSRKRTFKGGFTNKSTLFIKGKNRIVLREYKPARSLQNILFELNFVSTLKKNNLPVPTPLSKPIKTNNGYGVVFEYLPGSKISKEKLNLKRLENLMKIINKMHKIGEKINTKGNKDDRNLFTFNFDEYIKTNFYHLIQKKDSEFLSFELKDIKNKLKNAEKNLQNIIIHNDLGLINIKFTKNSVSAILDFDDCCKGPRISDLATLLADICVTKNKFNEKIMQKALKSYEKYSKIQKNELILLGLLIRHRLLIETNFYLWKYALTKNKKLLKKSLQTKRVLSKLRCKSLSHKGIKFIV